jgi:C-3',4' desaturase CrtD
LWRQSNVTPRTNPPDDLGAADVVVIGAGIAGLTAAAVLAADGAEVLVLERHNVPGGCASFYQRDGYRFDVGATLVIGFGERGVHRRLFGRFGVSVRATPVEPAMAVHLPDVTVVRYGDARWPAERRRAFGEGAEPFWQRQERVADLAWDFSARFPMLPVDVAGMAGALGAFRPRHLPLLATLGRPLAHLLPPDAGRRLRTFVDAQLLITAQTDAAHADLAYGATALDLARAGTFHLPDGPSTIAVALARVVRQAGGRIAYRTPVAGIACDRSGRVAAVRLADGRSIAARRVIAAIPAADVAALVPGRPPFARALGAQPQRWGAFMAYVALPAGVVPDDLALHHQVVAAYGRPPGEGNTVFLSLSGPGERSRARGGGRALTVSTHTDVAAWERAYRDGTYAARKAELGERLAAAVERVVPGAWARASFVDLATPHTFAHFTGRGRGLVGGVPQTPWTASLGAQSHRSGVPGLTLAGDTVFPGQSTVGASLSGVAAARAAGAAFRPG